MKIHKIMSKIDSNTTTLLDPTLSLAEIIEKAGDMPEYRAIFYKKFLQNSIYVLVQKNQLHENQPNSFNANVPIISFENKQIPVFTDPKHIYDQGILKQDVDYMKVNGRQFLELTLGHSIIVNPFSKVHKELVTNEIADMLNGSIFDVIEKGVAKVHMQTLIGKPEKNPTILLNSLQSVFSKMDIISAAYLGWTFNEKIDKKAHYIFAIECDTKTSEEFRIIADMISNLCKPYLKEEEYIDIIKLTKDGNFIDYFYKKDKPFYVR